MPVLTEKAVEGAAVIKYSQVFIPIFRTLNISITGKTGTSPTRTNPIRNAIRGQGIIIPRKKALLGGRTDFLPVYILPYSAVAFFTFSYLTIIKTIIAGNPAIRLRWRRR